jgi:hypothetical protein
MTQIYTEGELKEYTFNELKKLTAQLRLLDAKSLQGLKDTPVSRKMMITNILLDSKTKENKITKAMNKVKSVPSDPETLSKELSKMSVTEIRLWVKENDIHVPLSRLSKYPLIEAIVDQVERRHAYKMTTKRPLSGLSSKEPDEVWSSDDEDTPKRMRDKYALSLDDLDEDDEDVQRPASSSREVIVIDSDDEEEQEQEEQEEPETVEVIEIDSDDDQEEPEEDSYEQLPSRQDEEAVEYREDDDQEEPEEEEGIVSRQEVIMRGPGSSAQEAIEIESDDEELVAEEPIQNTVLGSPKRGSMDMEQDEIVIPDVVEEEIVVPDVVEEEIVVPDAIEEETVVPDVVEESPMLVAAVPGLPIVPMVDAEIIGLVGIDEVDGLEERLVDIHREHQQSQPSGLDDIRKKIRACLGLMA